MAPATSTLDNMTIHLIKDTTLSPEVFTEVFDLLTSIDGTIKFNCDHESMIDFTQDNVYDKQYENEIEFSTKKISANSNLSFGSSRSFPAQVRTASWETLFNKCTAYRKKKLISENDMVFLLTDISNSLNWFASLDETSPNNGFVHTADWDLFLSCPRQFPIAYEVIALLLHKYTFDNTIPITEQVHKEAIGCVSDFCMHKKDIILKMRTADVCGDCMTKMKKRMPMPDIIHALTIMDSLRLKMLYAQNFKQHVELSSIHVDQRNRIFLPEFGNIEIKLRPLEKALYLLFMRHPEGIYLSDLPDHRIELQTIYEEISHTGTREEMHQRIKELVNVTSNSASIQMARIKSAFDKAIGADLAKHYYIKGGNGERKRIEYLKSGVD